MIPTLADGQRRDPGPKLECRPLSPSDAAAYKELLVTLFAEFPQDGDATSEAAKPVQAYAQMMEQCIRRGGAYFGLLRQGELVAAAGHQPSHGHTRVELFGPAALRTARDPAILTPLLLQVFQAASQLPGVTHVTTEIDPSMQHMRNALFSAGFQRYGLLPNERVIDGQSYDAEFLYRAASR